MGTGMICFNSAYLVWSIYACSVGFGIFCIYKMIKSEFWYELFHV